MRNYSLARWGKALGGALGDIDLNAAGDYFSEHGVIFIEVGDSQVAMMDRNSFLPMTWVEFEFGRSGVCCIQARDLKQQQAQIRRLAS